MLKKYKVPIALLCLALFIIILGWGKHIIIKNDTNSLLNITKEIENNIKINQWQKAKSEFGILKDAWDTYNEYWPMFIDQGEMDRIQESIWKLDGFLESEDMTLSIAELNALSYFIRHIPEKDAFNMKNIF